MPKADPDDAPPAASTSTRISRRTPARRSVVNEHQARHLAQLVRLLERQALAHFHAPVAARLPAGRHAEFFRLDGYRIFLEGAYACGFVPGDLQPDNPLEAQRGSATEAIDAWPFTTVRRYVHYLVRHESWANGYSSPVYEALVAGHLQRVADRLERDESLYSPR